MSDGYRSDLVDEDRLPKFFSELGDRIGISFLIEKPGQLPFPR